MMSFHPNHLLCCLVSVAEFLAQFFCNLFLTFKGTIVCRSPQWNNALVQRSTKSNDKLSVTSIMLAMHRNIYI